MIDMVKHISNYFYLFNEIRNVYQNKYNYKLKSHRSISFPSSLVPYIMFNV